MSRFLHLRAFSARNARIGSHLTGHAINPALQPQLSCLPAWTLVDCYAQGDDYDCAQSFADCACRLFGEQLAHFLSEDISILQDVGIERLGDHHARLRQRYAALDQPAAREIVAWLGGSYTMTDDEVRTQ
jgi:hyaluronoglucosaminidase